MIFKLIFTVALATVAHGIWGPIDDLPPGPYCGNLNQCCIGREDHCAQPILGTLCYCDEFCNRTRSGDCCPDYFKVCLGEGPDPIISCEHNSQYYGENARRQENCNECTCVSLDNRTSMWQCTRDPCMMDNDVLRMVNNDRRLNWHATNYSSFWGHKLEEGLRKKLGTKKPAITTMRMNPIRRTQSSRMPRTFDAREKWVGLLTPIVEQGWCGASWAVSTVAVASDRFAVMSRGAEHVTLSAQQLLSCNNNGQQSCAGGHLDRAWRFVRKFGLVDEPCFPYTGQDSTKCSIPRRGNLRSAGCDVPPYRDQRYRTSPAHRLASEDDIMNDIQTSGPVQATMKVYQDFFHYAGGIYRQSKYGNNELTGFHSVRIIGWGEELGEKYWLVANSWGESWGEKGYFRIQRGRNECDIERFVIGVWAHTVEVFAK